MAGNRERQRAVEQEYEKPFLEVVREYASDGESVRATAAILGYASRGAFSSLLRRHGAREWFRDAHQTNGMRSMRESLVGKDTTALRAAREKAALLNPTYRRIEIDGITDTVAGHCRRLGLSAHSVRYQRRKNNLTFEQAIDRARSKPR